MQSTRFRIHSIKKVLAAAGQNQMKTMSLNCTNGATKKDPFHIIINTNHLLGNRSTSQSGLPSQINGSPQRFHNLKKRTQKKQQQQPLEDTMAGFFPTP